MKNAEWVIKEGIPFKKIKTIQHNPKENRWYEIAVRGKVVDRVTSKLEPADLFRKWLDMEHKEPILDDAEKRYLKGVIRPFRDQVKRITKYSRETGGKEYIIITTDCEMLFPDFEANTMYKGMELDHWYTLKELGL